MGRALAIGAPLAVALAALSLTLPYMPVYDPWAWLVWGRELAALDLTTAGGPSWKPLPVLIGAPLSLLGDAAPKAWLLVARSGFLLAPLLAGWLAARLAGPEAGRWAWVAAALAAASVALTADAFTPPLRQFTGGLSEPLLVALVLGAVALALTERPRAALWVGVAASLLRPECWPFLAVWAWRQWRRRPSLRPDAAAAAVLIPLAWFVPDLLGAGNPLQGSATARQGAGLEPGEAAEVAGRALAAPLAAIWVGVLLFVWRRRDGGEDAALTVLLVGAVAWVGVVAAMSVVGYAGLPRFLAPASAAFSIVGAVGLARAGAGVRAASGAGRPWPAVAAVVAIALAAGGFGLRAAQLPGDLRRVEHQSMLVGSLFAASERLPVERLLSCGRRVRLANLVTPPTALAWGLDVPIGSVRVNPEPRYGVALSTRPLAGGRQLLHEGRWRATQLPC